MDTAMTVTDPYATEEPIPYEPDHPDNLANQGPLDSTPATTDVLLTPDEAWAQAEQTPPVETEPLPPGNPFESPAFVIGKCDECGIVGGGHTPECSRYVAPA